MKRFLLASTLMAVMALPSLAFPDLVHEGPIELDAAPRGSRGSLEYLGPLQAIYVTGMVKNATTSRAGGVAVELVINDKIINRLTLGDIRGGDALPYTIKWVPQREDSYLITVRIDPSNSVREDVETNNSQAMKFDLKYNLPTDTSEMVPCADLAIQSFGISPEPYMGRPSSISCVVYNSGDLVARDVEVAIMVDGVRFTSKVIPLIQPESAESVIVSWTPDRKGPKTIGAVIDPEMKILESDEENNSTVKQVEVRR